MKNKSLILYSVALVALVITSIALTLAWYVNYKDNGKIDATTESIAFTYLLDGEKTNSYTISDLSFFDVKNTRNQNNTGEIDYFLTGCRILEVEIKNPTSKAISYDISYTPDVIENKNSKAYVGGFYTKSKLSDVSKYSSIEGLYNANKESAKGELKGNSSVKIYLYLYGVQEKNSARNEDFLYTIDKDGKKVYTTYSFNIIMRAQALKNA